jgi:N-acetylneuraminic acid mutarotase
MSWILKMPGKLIGFPLFVLTISLLLGGCGGGSSGSAGTTLVSIQVTPSAPTLDSSQSQQLTATGTYSDGSHRDISAQVVWTSDDNQVATVSTSGLLQAVRNGKTTVTALSGVISGSDALTVTGHWSATASLANARSGHAAVRLADGRVLVLGGYEGSTVATAYVIASAELYDPVAATWAPAADMPAACSGLTATLLQSGRVLAVCGAQAWLYDPLADSWSTAASPGGDHQWGAAVLLASGDVLLVSGPKSDATEVYHPASDTWTAAGNLPFALQSFTATRLGDGRVLVVGGEGTSATVILPVSQAGAWLYDPGSNTWSAAAGMTGPRSRHSASLLADGSVLVAGGMDMERPGWPPEVDTPLASAERYDPATDTWLTAASLPETRYFHTGTTLPSGQVLVVEGTTVAGTASSVLYDPASDAWIDAGAPATSRLLQGTATLLQDGALLEVAGNGLDEQVGADIFR